MNLGGESPHQDGRLRQVNVTQMKIVLGDRAGFR